MIGLDTSVLIRYITQDDEAQSPRANALIESLTEQIPGFVSIVAMVEMAGVLERAYGLAGGEVAAAIERLLQADTLVVEREQKVYTAMIALREGRGSFADSLISGLGRAAGCSHTATFDRRALRLAGFEAA